MVLWCRVDEHALTHIHTYTDTNTLVSRECSREGGATGAFLS